MAVNLDDHIPYQDYYSEHVKQGKVKSGQLIGLCPLHDDAKDSFSVDLSKGKWKCFAGCGEGNVISFHARLHSITNKEAFEQLCQKYNIPGSADKTKNDKTLSKDLPEKFRPIPAAVLNYLLEKRGWSEEFISDYQIGYSSKRQRYTIPVYDKHGDLVNIRCYAPGKENKVISWGKGYGSARLWPISMIEKARKDGKPIFLCEGEPDTACAISHGLYAVTQTAGCETWKDEFNSYFKGVDVIGCYDNDDPGKDGLFNKVGRNLPHFCKSFMAIKWPDSMEEKEDLTDWFMKYGRSVEELLALPMETIEPVGDSLGRTKSPANDDPNKIIEHLNETHAAILIGGKFQVMNEIIDPVFERPDITLSSIGDFKNFYANKTTWQTNGNGKAKQVSVADLWLVSPKRREYQGVVFDPSGKHGDEYYNLFKGLSCEPKKGNWQMFQDHIYDVIADKDSKVCEYVIAWLAHLFQHIGERPCGTSIVMRGDQGIGKGVFAHQIGAILGSHYVHIADSQQITGRFNLHLKGAVLVFVDEAIWAGDKAGEGKLKAMITEPTTSLEPKGKERMIFKNFARFLIASNNEWVVPAGIDERRFCVLDVSSKRRLDREYFLNLVKQMETGGREAMLYDLLRLDISKFNFQDFPRTDALFDQIYQSFDSVEKFWYERLRHGTLTSNDRQWESYIETQKLYAEYIEFANFLKARYPQADSQVIKKIKKLCPSAKNSRPVINGARVCVLRFDHLENCRKEFAEAVRIDIDWGDNE